MDEPGQKTLPNLPSIERKHCPICGKGELTIILKFTAPQLCNVLFSDRDSARATETRPVTFAYCRNCTHCFNGTFDASEIGCTQHYDSSLEHSLYFAAFAEDLVARLNRSYVLADKTIVEIGCGKGGFLKRLCTLSNSRGIGFDTSYEGDWGQPVPGVYFVKDYFSEAYADLRPDLLVCRHVLEHIAEPVKFLRSLYLHPGIRAETCAYFEVPNALYTLRGNGIWDLFYEHVSYFTKASLRMAFELAGFEVLDCGTSFGEQYLYIEVRPKPARRAASSVDQDRIRPLVNSFAEAYRAKIEHWSRYIAARAAPEIVVWGAGSKGITFVNAVPGAGDIGALVDVNPFKQGRFVPIHGTPVVSPGDLSARRPRSIIIMNPIYSDEIARMTAEYAPDAELILA